VDDIAAQGQGQAVIFLVPPDSQVLTDNKAFLLPGQLPFVNDQAGAGLAGFDGLKNFVERNDNEIELFLGQFQPELKGQKRAGHRAGHGDLGVREIGLGNLALGHNHRPVTVAHARAARQ
jgi:hypothetical protein